MVGEVAYSGSLTMVILHQKLARLKRLLRNGITDFLRLPTARFTQLGPPSGLFSALDELRSGSFTTICDGAILAEAQMSPKSPPDSIIAKSGLNQDEEQPYPVFWCRMEHVRLVGSGPVPLNARKQACVEALTSPKFARFSSDYNYLTLPKPTVLSGNWTSLDDPGFGSKAFYHWLHDCLPKLALVKHFPKDTLILLRNPDVPFKRQLLEFLGLWDRIRPAEHRHYLAEHYYMAPPMAVTGCYNPMGVQYLRDLVLPRVLPLPERAPERVFLTRRGAWRGITNLASVENFFSRRGWLVFDAGTHGIMEQIRILAGAREVCGVHGAALANLLWCPSNAKVTELFPDSNLNGCYEVLANTIGLEYSAMIFPSGPEHQIIVDLKALAERLDAVQTR